MSNISNYGIDMEIATDTVALWVQNDDALYEGAREAAFQGTTFDPDLHYPSNERSWGDFIEEAGFLIGEYVKDQDMAQGEGLFGEIVRDYLDSVDWREVANRILDANDYTGEDNE
jgi:hypothetical protein